MGFSIKVNTNEQAYALRNAMHKQVCDTGRVTEADVFKMLNLPVADLGKREQYYWTPEQINQIQIRELTEGWDVYLPASLFDKVESPVVTLDELIAREMHNYPDRIEDMVKACHALKSGDFNSAKKALGPDYDEYFNKSDSFEELQRALKRQLNALPTRVYVAYSKPSSPANYESEDEMVAHPPHYQSESGLEVIDVIKAFTEGLSGIVATDAGNIIKYACRWHKKNGVQDLKKILWYTQHLINELETNQEDIHHE